MKGSVTDIRNDIAAELNSAKVPEEGNPQDFTLEQLKVIVQDGQSSVQQHLTTLPEMLIGLTNAASQLGSMRMLLAMRIEEESKRNVE